MAELNYNPFSQYFLRAKNKADEEVERQIIKNSQGVSLEQSLLIDASQNLYGSVGSVPGAEFMTNQAAFRAIFSSKPQKIAIYREMSNFPEVVDALNIITDEAVTKDDEGNVVKLKIKQELPLREEKHIRKVFDYIVNEVLKFDERGWKMFRTWLIEAELFVEKILDDSGKRIIGVKILPAGNTYPYYEGNIIKKYVQSTKRITSRNYANQSYETSFLPNQICYLKWDDYGTSLLDIRGYLEPGIRTWNQYKNLQDSLVIYRLVRAPQRRLWNVEMGRLPPGKREQAMKEIIARYRKQYQFNAETGMIDSNKLFQAMTDDFWFPKSEGQGTTVDTLESNMNMGDLDDINLFLRALYKSLQIPKSRWEDTMNSIVANTAPGEITREEVRFSKMVNRFRNRFKKLFIDLLCTQLELSNQIDAKYRRAHLFDIEYCEENVFAEQKKLLNLKSRFEVVAMAEANIATKDNPNGLWTQEFVMKDVFGLNEQEYQEMQNKKKQEIAEQMANESGKEPEETPEEGEGETGEESTPISPELNTTNQEKNAETEPEATTPEGSSEQPPPEEPNQIQLP